MTAIELRNKVVYVLRLQKKLYKLLEQANEDTKDYNPSYDPFLSISYHSIGEGLLLAEEIIDNISEGEK